MSSLLKLSSVALDTVNSNITHRSFTPLLDRQVYVVCPGTGLGFTVGSCSARRCLPVCVTPTDVAREGCRVFVIAQKLALTGSLKPPLNRSQSSGENNLFVRGMSSFPVAVLLVCLTDQLTGTGLTCVLCRDQSMTVVSG